MALGAPVLCALLMGGGGPVVAGGDPLTYQHPGPDCPKAADHGLQDCVDGAAPGDIIHLAAEVLDDEVVAIPNNLTLTGSGPKPFPRLAGLSVTDGGPGSSVRVTIRGVRLILGARVVLGAGDDHVVLLDRVSIGEGDPPASRLDISTTVPAEVTVRPSRIHGADLDQGDVVHLGASDPDGVVVFRLVGNTIEAKGDPESGAGVAIEAQGDGTVQASLHNNVILDVASCRCGASSGIAILPDGPVRLSADIVGNTLHGFHANGVQQRNDLTGIGHLTLRIFGNVFSRLETGIDIDRGPAASLTYRGGYNDVFASGGGSLDGMSPGPGNRAVDPRFVRPAQDGLRLEAGSPLIDRVPVCLPTGVENLDAAGHGRLSGTSLDMGAHERGATAPTGVARTGGPGPDSLVGTNGADILCGLGGADGLAGLGGGDMLDGGPGDDVLFGNGGADRLLGGDGRDTLCAKDGVRGNDRSDGGAGVDGGRSDPEDRRIRIETGADCTPT